MVALFVAQDHLERGDNVQQRRFEQIIDLPQQLPWLHCTRDKDRLRPSARKMVAQFSNMFLEQLAMHDGHLTCCVWQTWVLRHSGHTTIGSDASCSGQPDTQPAPLFPTTTTTKKPRILSIFCTHLAAAFA